MLFRSGNVERVVTLDETLVFPGSGILSVYKSQRLGYAKNGQTLTFVAKEEWLGLPDDPTYLPTDYRFFGTTEFRYDGARQRYMKRIVFGVETGSYQPALGQSDVWTDYDGDRAYGDFTVSSGNATMTTLYEPGMARRHVATRATRYVHNDLIGTLRNTSDSSGTAVSSNLRVITAFGEPVAGPGVDGAAGQRDRFGYAGAFGYQTDKSGDFPFLHLGARYYDPEIGRTDSLLDSGG